MDSNEALNEIKAKLVVTRQGVIEAKRFIVDRVAGSPDARHPVPQAIAAWQAAAGWPMPPGVVITETVDDSPDVPALVASLQAYAAGREAIQSLLGAGIVVMVDAHFHDQPPSVTYRIANTSGTWQFEELGFALPNTIRLARSMKDAHDRTLTDPDLLVAVAGALAEPVQSAVGDAVRCFRSGLHTPAVAMLGVASEAAWSMAARRLTTGGVSDRAVEKLAALIGNPRGSIEALIDQANSLYHRADLYADLQRASGVRVEDVQEVADWSHQVRDSRRVLHFGAQVATPNSFEKVAVLLLAAGPHLHALQRIAATPDAEIRPD